MNIKELVGFYKMVWEKHYGFPPVITSWGKIGKLFKPLLEIYTSPKMKAIVLLHFKWYGANNDDDFIYRQLENRCFPIEWIPKNTNQYMAFLVNHVGLKEDRDFEEWVKENI